MDNITGFFVAPIFLRSWRLVISEEDILKAGTNFFKKSTELVSNGVDKKSIFTFLQYFAREK